MHVSLKSAALAVGVALYGSVAMAQTAIDTTSYKQPASAVYLFEQGMPDTVSASKGSKLNIVDVIRKDGQHSLEWTFKKNSKLTFAQDVGFKPYVKNNLDQSIRTFSTWIYSEKPIEGKLRFSFEKQGQQQAWFDVNMGFTGWRNLLIPYQDMQGKPVEGMDKIVVETNQLASGGVLHFDQLMTAIPVDPRWHTRDELVPYINLKADTSTNQHWLAIYRYNEFLKNAPMKLIKVTDEQIAEIETVKDKLQTIALNGTRSANKAQIDRFKSMYKTFEIVEHNGKVMGIPLDNKNRLQMFFDGGKNKGFLDQNTFDVVNDVKLLRAYGDYMRGMAIALQGELSASDRAELETMYINLTQYGFEQGFVSGSGLGTVHHFGYTLRALFEAHFLSRDLLEQHGLLDETSAMMAWFSATGRIYRPVEEMTSFNVDVMNTQLRAMLYSIVMQPNDDTRNAQMEQFKFWLSKSLTNSVGLSGGFKKDGSIFHHIQHYPAYGNGALGGITPVIEALSGTDYAVTPQAHQIVRKAVAMTEISTNDMMTMMSVNGRHPNGKQNITLPPFKHMAMAGTPDGKQAIDPQMAAAYLRLTEGAKNDAFRDLLIKEGFEAKAKPVGNWTMNLASMNIHRRDDWVAAVRGFSRYLVGNETYQNANLYGRYINYGQLEIMSADAKNRAFSHDGWNWNRWSGTTAVQLPFEQLKANVRNVDTYSGMEEMLFSEQTFAGGLSNGKNGMYSMILQGHAKYDASFRANKSVFFFDNRIVALGSDIQTDVNAYPTQTTLFQHALRTPSDVATIDGKAIKGKERGVKAQDRMTQLVDPEGNVYFVPKQQNLRISATMQQSADQSNGKPTKGQFATAVLDHGTNPEGAGYEYSVLVNPEVKQLNKYAAQLAKKHTPYTVMQKDSEAHVVFDRASKTTGYAVFKDQASFDQGLVANLDKQALVMVKEGKKGINLSLVNPDLNLYQGIDESQYKDGVQQEVSIYSRKWKSNAFKPVTNKVTLRGQWQAAKLPKSVTLKQVGENTEVSFKTLAATPIQLKLSKA